MTASRAMPARLEELAGVAAEACRRGAVEAERRWTRRDLLRIEDKAAAGDLVTDADRAAEDAIRAALLEARPHDGVLGEEFGATGGATGIVWAVDPIDGTAEYVYGRANWAVSVAALKEGSREVLAAAVSEPAFERMNTAIAGMGAWCDGARLVVPPARSLTRALVEINLGAEAQRKRAGAATDALVPHVRDLRIGGGAAAALCSVAAGRIHAYWGPGLNVWDAAAGILIAREAGALTGDLSGVLGARWPESGNVLAASAEMYESLCHLLRPVYV